MLAAVYAAHGRAREVLSVVEVADPQPAEAEVRVRLRVSGVNPTDWKARAAGPDLRWPQQIPNQDGAGEIDAVGAGVDAGRVGQRVWVYHGAAGRPNGTAAQFICVPASQAPQLPDGVSFDQAAGLGIPFITAHRCVYGDGPVEGRSLLVTGGAGAVGNAAIQLARWGGARVVSTVSSDSKAELATLAGAHAVLNYRTPDFLERLRAAAPGGVQRVVDVALGANIDASLTVLAPHGVIVTYANEASDPVAPVRRLMVGNVTLRFVLVYNLTPGMIEAAVREISRALQAGALKPLPEHHFPLSEIAAAHEAVENGTPGKVLVDIP